MLIRKQILALATGIALLAAALPSSAVVIVDPSVGRSGNFNWFGGLGQIDRIDGLNENTWQMTLAADSNWDLATVSDGFVPGDEFEIVIDGSSVAWTDTSIDGSGYFTGALSGYFLSAGTHNITLNVVQAAAGFTGGRAFYDFSAVSPASVPEPSTMLLLLAGLGGLGAWRRGRRAAV